MPNFRAFSVWRWLAICCGGLVVVAAVFYAVAYLLVGGGVAPNTSVAGVAIGGLSPADAQAKLARALAPAAQAPVAVVVGDQRLTLDPVDAGLRFDARATVASAPRRSANPVELARALFGHRAVAPAVSVDTTKLAAAVDALDASVRDGGHDGAITFDGVTPVAVAPVKGEGIAKEKAMAALAAGYLSSSGPIELPTAAVDPSISDAEVQRVLDTVAKPAVAAPITLDIGATSVEISPEVIAKNLTFKASGSSLVPIVDGAGVATSLGDALSALDAAGKDASFDVSSGTPVVVPATPGKTADIDGLGPAIAAVLSQPSPRRVVAPTIAVPPTLTTQAAESLGIKEKVSTFTTYHPCCAPRVTNIHKMADIVNGHIVMPGETFSLNAFVGERDTKRGFVPAPMILGGLYVDSVGGGVSQFTTTLYNAVFFAGLKDVEHHTHSYYISRYPAGREATISFPEPNFIFQNDTPTAILIQTSYTGTSLTVTFWGTKYYDVTSSSSARYAFTTAGTVYNTRSDCESAAGGPGFQIDVTQTLSKDGVVVKKNVLHTRYDPEPVIICGPAPSPSP